MAIFQSPSFFCLLVGILLQEIKQGALLASCHVRMVGDNKEDLEVALGKDPLTASYRDFRASLSVCVHSITIRANFSLLFSGFFICYCQPFFFFPNAGFSKPLGSQRYYRCIMLFLSARLRN